MTRELTIGGSACTLWRDGPAWAGTPAAAIGRLRIASFDSGVDLLATACAALQAEGCHALLAPMDGDTWHAYRVITESDGSPPFAMEPTSGPHDLAVLQAGGFSALEHYASSRAAVPPPGTAMPHVPGITVTAWDGHGAELLLGQLHALAGGSFADKLFFKSLDLDGFLRLYQPLLTLIDPRLVLFARDDNGRLAGFLFGMPDIAQGPRPSQVILKTYASMQRGVGHLLAWHFHELARELGYQHVVHALMHSRNVSLDRSRQHQGDVFRRYAIFGKRLDG